MKDYRTDECSIGDRKSSGYCHWRGLGKENVFVRAVPTSKPKTAWRRLRLAAVNDGGPAGNTKLTTELTITVVKADKRPSCTKLDGKLRTAH